MEKIKGKEVIVGVTASIAIYKACDLVRRLRDVHCNVTVVMTHEAQELISPVVFESLSGNKVYTHMFKQADAWEVEHVALADKANLVLIAPATAHSIAKIAAGLCDDMLSCIVCATRAKVLFAPAMNDKMFTNKIVQENMKKLKALGYGFIDPRKGKLACGAVGIGCLADIETIVKQALSAL
ncbi:MAG: hypothetical protein KBA46_00215 [Candidatus Omnitrophica bacterium]|nr:hypothetical protein [Candidatus Omnitrophota bacterium]